VPVKGLTETVEVYEVTGAGPARWRPRRPSIIESGGAASRPGPCPDEERPSKDIIS